MNLLTNEQMKKLNTKRLLAYKNALMKVPEGPNYYEDNVERLNKTSPRWQDTYFHVKTILASREHVK